MIFDPAHILAQGGCEIAYIYIYIYTAHISAQTSPCDPESGQGYSDGAIYIYIYIKHIYIYKTYEYM